MEALCLALQGLVVPDTCCSRRFLLLGQPCPGTRPRRGLQHCRRYWVVVAGRVLGPISILLSLRLRMTLLIFKCFFGVFLLSSIPGKFLRNLSQLIYDCL